MTLLTLFAFVIFVELRDQSELVTRFLNEPLFCLVSTVEYFLLINPVLRWYLMS